MWPETDRQVHTAFRDATAFVLDVVDRVDRQGAPQRGGWDAPGLGVWTVRDLVGHTSRSLLTVESYLRVPCEVVLATPADYLLASREAANGPDVAHRGRDAGAALGDDPAAAVHTIAERVLPLVAGADPDDVVATPFGGTTLRAYLPTRVLELTVHGCDLASAIGVPAAVPVSAAEVTGAVLAAVAARRGLAEPFFRSLTGRGPLPEGFSAIG